MTRDPRGFRRGRRLARRVADRLDVVAVRVEDEGAVVSRVIVGAYAGGAIVLAAGGEGGGVEGVHRRAVGRGEGHVGGGLAPAAAADPEERTLVAVAGEAVAAHHHLNAQWL